MPNVPSADILISRALASLKQAKPSGWDSLAYDAWEKDEAVIEELKTRPPADKKAAWNAAIRQMRVLAPTDFKTYERLKREDKEAIEYELIEIDWPHVIVGGQTSGGNYNITLDIEGTEVKLILSKAQLTDPEYVIDAVQHETGKFNINNPYIKDIQAWKIKVLMQWWPRLVKSDEDDFVAMIGEVVKDFCAKKVLSDAAVAPFNQSDHAVVKSDDGQKYIYVPAKGLLQFVNSRFDKTLARKTLTNALGLLGFSKGMLLGDSRLTWRRILYSKLYDESSNTPSGETRVGEEQGARGDAASLEGLALDEFYAEERGGSAEAGTAPLFVDEG